VEKVFGTTRRNSEGKLYSPRDVAEQHILEDLGTIPSLGDWLKNTPIEKWMGGRSKSDPQRVNLDELFKEKERK
jgi:hypothetical protein